MKTSRGVIPLIAALAAIALMYVSFTAGVSAALDGSGSGSAAWQVVFIVAAVVVAAAIVFAAVNIVKNRSRVLGIVTIVVCLVPVAIIAALLGGLTG